MALPVEALDFELPERLLATEPAEPRDSARLMVYDRARDEVGHHRVRDLPDLGVLGADDLVVVNDTRVAPAYLAAVRTGTGGRVTGLVLAHDVEAEPAALEVLLESRGKLQVGERLDLVAAQGTADAGDAAAALELEASVGPGKWRARVVVGTVDDVHALGGTPLPPYIRKRRKQMGRDEATADDASRYNTVFAQADAGAARSAAAPTAGLHFTDELLARLPCARASVTLHVGQGTFAPVRVADVDDHAIHAEMIDVSAATCEAIAKCRAAGGKVFCVGTTTVRALESLPGGGVGGGAGGEPGPLGLGLNMTPQAYAGPTELFITPTRVALPAGHPDRFVFRFTDRLMTNFHLPRSTLLAMVASLPGVSVERLLTLYDEAIGEGYRFYSYGDAMLIV
ncbi:MAG: S-adenosylmethionine:tRNA ribosyltransferase-isomerase [Planctomycetota bacterium]